MLEGLARINVIRRFSARSQSDHGKIETYLQREIAKLRESLRELPDRTQQVGEIALDRTLYPIVALADVYAGKVMVVEPEPPPAPPTAKRAPPPPTRPNIPAPTVGQPPPIPGSKPLDGPPAVHVGATAHQPASAPIIAEQKRGAFDWASELERKFYGSSIAGERVLENARLILNNERPTLGRVVRGELIDEPARPINEREAQVEWFTYWLVFRMGFMSGEKADQLSRNLRRHFVFQSLPSHSDPPPPPPSLHHDKHTTIRKAITTLVFALICLLGMFLLHVESNRARQDLLDAVAHVGRP
ncbi:MAG: hypothetical protein U0326_15825 [Polyangiales bacterium]